MGCGASNTLESSDFKNMENAQRTKFLKIVENEKILERVTENNLKDAVEDVENEEDLKKLINDMIYNYEESFKQLKLTDQEMMEAVMYRMSKFYINRNIEESFENPGGILKDMLNITEESLADIAGQCLNENTGNNCKALYVGMENPDLEFCLKIIFQTLKFDNEYSSFDSIVILIHETAIENLEIMKDLASFIKLHPHLKNLVIGISDEGKACNNMDHLSYVFEGIAVSKHLRNFGILRLSTYEYKISELSVSKIVNALETCKLNSIGLSNLYFGNTSLANDVVFAIAKNPNISLIGLQLMGIGERLNQIPEICKMVSCSKSLKCLLLGVETGEESVESLIEQNEKILKRGNNNFKCFIIDHFKK
jgi:hypothetical protein